MDEVFLLVAMDEIFLPVCVIPDAASAAAREFLRGYKTKDPGQVDRERIIRCIFKISYCLDLQLCEGL